MRCPFCGTPVAHHVTRCPECDAQRTSYLRWLVVLFGGVVGPGLASLILFAAYFMTFSRMMLIGAALLAIPPVMFFREARRGRFWIQR